MRSVLLIAMLAAVVGCPLAQTLGETTFPNSGSQDAQEPFLRGLLLLHSFEYVDARDAFQEAQSIDPSFAMAYWGEAMTHNHPIWMRQDREAALAVLESMEAAREDPRHGLSTSDRENAYLSTLTVLFEPDEVAPRPKEERDDRYAEAMRQLAAAYPGDLDAQAFHALAILGTAHEGRDFPTYMHAASILEEVFAANPRHPGAAHYLIHAYDDPVHAPLGLRPARVYDQIAPAASHALHMPSHIYLALGMWPETAEMNRRSYLAAKANSDRRGGALNGHGWHALWWWHYAAIQLGDRPLADSLLQVAQANAGPEPTATATAHVTRIASQQAHAFADWDAIRSLPAVQGGSATTLAADVHARAFAARAAGDAEVAFEVTVPLDMKIDGYATAEEVPWQAMVTSLSLDAAFLLDQGDAEDAVAVLRRAAEIESAAPLTFGPPAPAVPANEALGLLLLDLNRVQEAVEAFEASLARAPNRRQSVEGLRRAQSAGARATAD
ncbi:MAG: hypothetical protein AAGK21_08440 [Bacteroidota bacterium]